jgi:LacI family transcriptional regulator
LSTNANYSHENVYITVFFEENRSVATVSRALNATGVVTPKLKQKILQVASRLQYVPNSGARSLITRRTHTIGVVLPDVYGEFFSELIRGIDLAARGRKLHLLISTTHGSAEEAATAIRAMSGRVDGLLLMSPHLDTQLLRDNVARNLPTVLINSNAGAKSVAAVSVDHYGGAFAMVRHLASLGHRRIAHIAGPVGNFDAKERIRGYRDALKKFVPGASEQIIAGDFREESGYRAGQEILASNRRPQAVFAANDMMAIGCLYALTQGGLRVPDDIALAGFDDIPLARFVTPALTTVRVEIADLGGRALSRLAAAMESEAPSTPVSEILHTDLVIRASCGARRSPKTFAPAVRRSTKRKA